MKQPFIHKTIATRDAKRDSTKPEQEQPLAQGLNRRAFMRSSASASLLLALAACKPQIPKADKEVTSKSDQPLTTFNQRQAAVIQQVQQLLFPDDGDGPDARAINAYGYLEFALTDKQNIADGDPEFLGKGVTWLSDLAEQTLGEDFLKLDEVKQQKLLEQIAQSSAGDNWLSLLMYYLVEALLLDPVYGGNYEQIGWRWLEHQPGFPRPEKGTTYRDFS